MIVLLTCKFITYNLNFFSSLVLFRLLTRRRLRPGVLVAEHVATASQRKPQNNSAKVFAQVRTKAQTKSTFVIRE